MSPDASPAAAAPVAAASTQPTSWDDATWDEALETMLGRDLEGRTRLPIVVSDWASWLAAHPDTLVFDIETGYDRDYTPGSAYGDYCASAGTLFPVYQRSQQLPEKSVVFGLLIDGTPKAYPLRELQRTPVVNDELAGRAVVVVTDPASRAVRAYEGGALAFEPVPTRAPSHPAEPRRRDRAA